jgi:hypothetical protein
MVGEASMPTPTEPQPVAAGYDPERLLLLYVSLKKALKDHPRSWAQMPHILVQATRCWLRLAHQHGWATGFRIASWGVRDVLVKQTNLLFPVRYPLGRLRFPFGVQPLSQIWGFDRGIPIHRYYLKEFLQQCSADIRGHCLESQGNSYTSQLCQGRVTKLDILHKGPGNPVATIVADITTANTVPNNLFDCIICTYVLNIIFDLHKAVSELYRMLKPGGVLLVAVPQSNMCAPQWPELWRFTPEGLRLVLTQVFAVDHVSVRAYGNSLTAAGDLRALVADEFTNAELQHHDPRFGVIVCARAVKRSNKPEPGFACIGTGGHGIRSGS